MPSAASCCSQARKSARVSSASAPGPGPVMRGPGAGAAVAAVMMSGPALLGGLAGDAEPAQAETREDVRDEHGERERAGWCHAVAARMLGTLAAGAGSLAASSSAIAHRRGPLPAAPIPRTRRSTHPAVTHRGSRPAPSWPGRSVLRRVRQSPSEKPQLNGPERRALSGSAPPTDLGRSLRSRHQGDGRKRPPLTLETSADPAGLTARARPKARPGTRAARPRHLSKGRGADRGALVALHFLRLELQDGQLQWRMPRGRARMPSCPSAACRYTPRRPRACPE